MSRETANRICAALPAAACSDPWGGGHDCWKVGGSMFALVAARMPAVSVKTDSVDTAEMLIDAGFGQRAASLHRSWIALPLEADKAELRHRITTRYRLIRGALPKAVQAGFPD